MDWRRGRRIRNGRVGTWRICWRRRLRKPGEAEFGLGDWRRICRLNSHGMKGRSGMGGEVR